MKYVLGITYEIRGRQYISQNPVIYASKHQSCWETFLFNYIIHDPTFVTKKAVLWIPPFGWFLMRLGTIPVNRSQGLKAIKQLIRAATLSISQKRPIIIYPEGTRTPPNTSPSLKPGVFVLYQKCGVNVVPIALNSGCFWPKHQFLKRPGNIVVEFLPPISPGLDKESFMNKLETTLNERSQALYDETLHKKT